MHGNGCIEWSDGKKYVGVIILLPYSIRNILKTKNTVKDLFNGVMEEDMRESGSMVDRKA